MTAPEMKQIMSAYIGLHQLKNEFDWNDKSFDLVFQQFYAKFKTFVSNALE